MSKSRLEEADLEEARIKAQTDIEEQFDLNW